MPRYKKAEWGDEGYDAIEHLIDNDPVELARLFRLLLHAVRIGDILQAGIIVAEFDERGRATRSNHGGRVRVLSQPALEK